MTYNFAGGIEVGSPVRVSGIKVGKVEKIEFFVPTDPKATAKTEPGSDAFDDSKAIAPLRVKVSVRKDAAVGVREDSQFYVNLAGIIGERYVEITPGHMNSPQVKENQTVAGIDPPRIDQLISQSFDLAGKIKDIIDENKGDITPLDRAALQAQRKREQDAGMGRQERRFQNGSPEAGSEPDSDHDRRSRHHG